MTTTLPRPSRPLIAPPTGPLPSLPVPKSRSSNVSPASARASSASLLPSPAVSLRAVSSSALPQRPILKSHPNSTSNVPTLNTDASPAGPLPPGKSLRKTISIGAFPQPPKHVGRTASHPPSPLSASSTPSSDTLHQRLSSGSKATPKTTPSREGSIRKPGRVSTGGRSLLAKSPLTPPSLLNGSGESVAVVNSGHLSLPSPPQSRNSSAQGSYATSATTFEDIGDEESRGRSDNKTNTDRHSTHKDGKGNVLVSVRVRPDVGTSDGKQELEWEINGKRSLVSYKGREGGEYIYDNVFDTQDNNARVYDAAAKRLVRRVMEGYHGTVFAYGMTGTGKTFSMQGTATNPGVIPLAITDIFSYIRETPHREFLLRVSYLEIYNERIHDLLTGPVAAGLNGQPTQQEEIKLREDSKRGVYATPLKEEIVQSPTQLLRVIARGDNARRVAGTQFNARSSRSHAVVQIVVESRERAPGGLASLKENKRSAMAPGGVRVSTLSLIDLAGSEKAADNKERRTEGSHINKSLLTLGTVIARLSSDKDKAASDKDKDKPSKDQGKHLPYRDSKLTRLLQPALSGNSLVSILCTIQIGSSGSIAAAHSHTGETLNTLKFASRAKNNIISHAKKADESLGSGGDAGSRALLDRYRVEIQELRKQLEEQNKAKDNKDGNEEEKEREKDEEEEKARELEDRHRHEEQMLEMQLARTALKERIEHLNRLILSSKSLGVNATNRSFSSMSLRDRGSVLSNGDFQPISVRSSSASHATLEVPGRTGSQAVFPSIPLEGSEEDDSLGENGDGTASHTAQIHALQTDLADKNRYISTLEKRLLQARRSSHSRVSMSLTQKMSGSSEDGGLIATIAEKDAEISNLRAQLDDKEKMIAALTSAGKKRENAHEVGSDGSPGSRRTSHQRSEGSTCSLKVKSSPISPVGFLSNPKSERELADVTRMLDEMISGRVDHANGARRMSLPPVNEDR
ncbi:kinesin-domain-containing protein [Lindgomyces ingoldianus]|uniref:Kinesin-domain-containing protein n=1 Tax=Lindgomyces ingoldianus TaxID=673940 RepID=A0ACB6R6V6_9PLEO|nr:kinesin-domain-containing protein [Lindgomyces ingoldianus]KAF2474795.1 kinesin-domain-containing protein [Lindgomyces ingoldianus]